MKSHRPTSKRSVIWRGDLVRTRLFQAAYTDERQDVLPLIDKLGFTAELPVDRLETDRLTIEMVVPFFNELAQSGTKLPIEEGTSNQPSETTPSFHWAPTLFRSPPWKSRDQEPEPDDISLVDNSSGVPVVPIPFRHLATWPQLRNRLQPLLSRSVVTRKIDEKKLVQALCRCESIAKLPRIVRKRSPEQVHVIADRSDRCIPFFKDQHLIARQLTRELARDQCRFSVGRAPYSLDRSTETLRTQSRSKFSEGLHDDRIEEPDPQSTVLILGDLAVLERNKPQERAIWIQYCRRWRQQGVKIYALVPYAIDQLPRELAELVEPIAWQGNGVEYASDELRAQLLRAIFVRAYPAMQLEPELLRELRTMVPEALDASLESDLWQHEWLASNHVSGARNDRVDIKEDLHGDFERLDRETKRRVLSTQRRFRQMLGYRTLWQLEFANLTADSREVLDESEQDTAAMRRTLKEYEDYVLRDAIPDDKRDQIVWYSRRTSEAALSDPLIGDSVRLLQRTFHQSEPWHPATTMEELKTDGIQRLVRLMPGEERLGAERFRGSGNAFAGGGNSVVIEGTCRGLALQVPELDSKTRREQAFWKSGRKPDWVSDFGTDEYGAWCEFQVPRHDSKGMVTQRMRWIKPGEFMMGSPDKEQERTSRETQHQVTLTQGYWMADSQVTQELWMAISGGENPSRFQGAANPVEQVSWKDCQAWISKLGLHHESLRISLPTEAQWEYACRAGSTTAYCFGDDPNELSSYGWFNQNSQKTTHPVKQLLPNDWGLYDMHGNVLEWCSDWYGDYEKSATSDPTGPAKGAVRVIRGGSWLYPARNLRSACRFGLDPGSRYNFLGFRLLSSAQGAEPSERAMLPVAEQGTELARAIQIRVKDKEPSRSDSFWKSGVKPQWVSDYGRDHYGLWCEFQVPRYDEKGFVTQRMRWIKPGTFLMGSTGEEKKLKIWDETQHEVTLMQGYWLADTQVTQELWRSIAVENSSEFPGDSHPVERVSWSDCQGWLRKILKSIPTLELTLPTEAQWEYACRAGSKAAYCFGDDPKELPKYGWFVENSKSSTHPVKQLLPNDWGLYDMHGNVWEWCRDWYGDYKKSVMSDPTGPARGAGRVIRGGSWINPARGLRSACRDRDAVGDRNYDLGFRIAGSAQGAEPSERAMLPVAEQGTELARAIQVRVKDKEPSRSDSFWKSGVKPQWVSDYGRDHYGLWCEFQVPRYDEKGFVTQRMRWIKPGTFLMGSTGEEKKLELNDETQHEVTLTQGYWLADTQVAQELWRSIGAENPSRFPGDANPVEQISWSDCQEWLRKLSISALAQELTLPTEAQWEYACRAGSTTAYCFGNDLRELPKYGWFGENSKSTTHPVKQLLPNDWGLYDMHGNVWEWCSDWYGDYEKLATSDPTGPAKGTYRVLRGGSWEDPARNLRSACRGRYDPGNRRSHLGFRLLSSAQGAEPNERAMLPVAEQGTELARIGSAEPAYEFLRSVDLDATGENSPEEEFAEIDMNAYTSIRVVSDQEGYQFDRLEKPIWAVEFGSDSYGLHASFELSTVRQKMRWIPPGRFLMGSPDGKDYEQGNEYPQHEVIITHGYWMFDTPCTQGLWSALMGENPSYFPDDDRPVEQVSWQDAVEFARKLNERMAEGYPKDGRRLIEGWDRLMFRLPTEAEWEYACRAGTTSDTYAGDLEIIGDANAPLLDSIAWYGGNSGHEYDLKTSVSLEQDWLKERQYPEKAGGTRKVGFKAPNAWGLYDMLGNVFEWCQDWGENYPTELTERMVDPIGPATGTNRVVRGGGWMLPARFLRSACRLRFDPGSRDDYLGFRLLSSAHQAVQATESDQEASQGEIASGGRGTRPTTSDEP